MRKLKLDELGRLSVDEFRKMAKRPLVVVLDNIRSAMNVGSVFRTCDAFAVQHLYLCGITASPPHREILKSAIGSTDSVSWSKEESAIHCLQNLKKGGWVLLGVEQTDQSIDLQDYQLAAAQKYALVLGNEVDGISEQVLELLDTCIQIPQWGTKHSLNVSVCAGIVLWHLLSQEPN